MANAEHLAILRRGVEAWNRWRRENPKIRPDLVNANLANADLFNINLRLANLHLANLQEALLLKAEVVDADLTEAYLVGARLADSQLRRSDLTKAHLAGADLMRADLTGTDLSEADLTRAELTGADLTGSNLVQAKLVGCVLAGADLNQAVLQLANFTNASLGHTIFASTTLNEVIGLETVVHLAPSTIGVDTLIASGKLPETFLRGCGVPDAFIEYLPSLLGAMEPIQYHSCFISYSTKDEAFARRLHERMRAEHLRVWFAPEDIQGGKKLHEQLEGAIQLYDKLLLVLSEHSIQSEWVTTEIYNARQTELRQQRRKLFPIRLTDMDTLKTWRCFDADTGKDLAREVREYHIPDFSNWKDHDAFELAFARLLRDLRATDAPPAPGVLPPVVVQPSAQAHRDSLIATKTRRLYALEQQQAAKGLNAPAELIIEIEDLREELEQLKAQREGE